MSAAALGPKAEEIVEALGLERHPEGGWFRETFRDAATDPSGRARSTAIYYLLAAGERSHWHRVDAAEAWHWHAGAALALRTAQDDGPVETAILGPDVVGGQRPRGVVAAGVWQSAESLGAWTLVGCTVAPGFLYEGFELAPEDWSPGGA